MHQNFVTDLKSTVRHSRKKLDPVTKTFHAHCYSFEAYLTRPRRACTETWCIYETMIAAGGTTDASKQGRKVGLYKPIFHSLVGAEGRREVIDAETFPATDHDPEDARDPNIAGLISTEHAHD